MGLNSPVLNR